MLKNIPVEWNKVSDIATIQRGRVMSKEYLIKNLGDFPVFSSQTANNGMIGKIQTFDYDGEYISWTTDGANAGTVFYRNEKFSVTNVCGIIQSNGNKPINHKFLFYWLSIQAKRHVVPGMGNPKLMSHQFGKILVPIPYPDDPQKSLAIQTEIVRILDTFKELTAELTAELAAELAARKKQYDYYRGQLLSFDQDERTKFIDKPLQKTPVEWTPLGKVVEILRGKRLTKKELTAQKPYPVFHGGLEPMGYYDQYNRSENSTMIINVGASAGTVGYCSEKFWSSDGCFCLSKNGKINSKFLYYFLSIEEHKIKSQVRVAGIPTLDAGVLKNIRIPIPYPDDPEKSLAIQAEIVRILDKFDTLTTSLSEGLPREIELRQQQYEYYRDMLFSFSKPTP